MNHFEYIESTAGHVPVCPLKSIFASWGSTPHLIHDFLTPAVHPMHTVRHLDRIICFLQGSQSWPTDTKTTLLTPRVALGRTCMICVRYGLIGLDCNPYRCRSFARIYPILNFWANPLGTRDDAKEQYCTELMQPLPNYWISSRNKLSPIVNKYRDLIVPNRIVFSCVEWWPITSTQLLWTATVRPRATECSRRGGERGSDRGQTDEILQVNFSTLARYAVTLSARPLSLITRIYRLQNYSCCMLPCDLTDKLRFGSLYTLVTLENSIRQILRKKAWHWYLEEQGCVPFGFASHRNTRFAWFLMYFTAAKRPVCLLAGLG